MTHAPARIWALRLVQAIIAAALLIAVVWIARPTHVVQLLEHTDPGMVGIAFGTSLIVVLLRALRLRLILPAGRLGLGVSIQVTAVSQAATSLVPARLGELALPVLLKRVAALELSSGLGALLIARSLDLASLGIWGSVAVAARWGGRRPVLLLACLILVAPALLLPVTVRTADRLATRFLAARGRTGRRWTRRIRRVRRALNTLAAMPGRMIAAMGVSLTLWFAIWVTLAVLLGAVGYTWPFGDVLVGAAAASLATLVPVNLIANAGTLEAGWTAGFAAVGIPVPIAAASGIAIHLLSLMIVVAVGSCAGFTLWLSRPHPRR